ncbi:hypothetical protein [Rhodopirellula sp. P2]|uniref:hypothetical protein n=1 Tax=Rhodopirellula sp. P2 TaxID=2127060 RepID=UPI00236789CA|nr:hypothetical protein [Rhodopirellula sp. P2]WDQ16792.1 hypothetical protein PSR62_24715 [Rhodopirellula sp. P2]
MRMFRGVSSGHGVSDDRSADAVFLLCMGELPMLILSRDATGWSLRYTDEFKTQDRVSPLVPFPDVEKVYRSKEIWPFFAVRIPSIARPEIQRTVRSEQLDYSDVAAMLSRFGKRSIADPFELRPQPVGGRRVAAM